MSFYAFVAAVTVLLATPGPTNTLLSLAAYTRGAGRSLPLLLGEIAGYLSVVVPVATLAGPLLDSNPAILPFLKLGAGLWVLLLAASLWRSAAASQDGGRVTVAKVYLTTLLNPKAPIIATVIMPHGPLHELAPWLAWLTLLILAAGGSWIAAGAALGRATSGQIATTTVRRVAAVALFGFSMLLAGTSVRALV